MALFADGVKKRIKRDGIVVRDESHWNELYDKYRDEIFMEHHGKTYEEWRKAEGIKVNSERKRK